MRAPLAKSQLLVAAFHLFVWLLLTLLVLLQFLGVVWNSSTRYGFESYGEPPERGLSHIDGWNDEPYSDRLVVCASQGRSYVPLAVNDALALGTTQITDTTGTAIHGYRVVKRFTSTMTPDARSAYAHTCSVIAPTLETILQTCTALGYNVTRDYLRIVDDLASTTMFEITQSLPVLVMPYWDNGYSARFVVPGWDGSACMFRLMGKYIATAQTLGSRPRLLGVTRTAREQKTVEWLRRAGGTWRNGWYEDLEGSRWYSDVMSNDRDRNLGVAFRQFDMLTGASQSCEESSRACSFVIADQWGDKFRSTSEVLSVTSIAIADGERFGLFEYTSYSMDTIASMYDWTTLVASALALRILARWLFAMLALYRGYAIGASSWRTTGIGCLAYCASFNTLPLFMLPHLKTTLFAFWTSACLFEGQQRALANAWFVMYPAIVEVMLVYYSLLNLIARLAHVRVSDALFGPCVLYLCALHWFRVPLADSAWLGYGGRVAGCVSPSDFVRARLHEFFTTSLALRTGGRVQSILVLKLLPFGASLFPLVWRCVASGSRWRKQRVSLDCALAAASRERAHSNAEQALAVHLANASGLGQRQSEEENTETRCLDSYELVRLGYVVFGSARGTATRAATAPAEAATDAAMSAQHSTAFVVSIDDWDLLTLVAPLRSVVRLWNHRVTAFPLVPSSTPRDSAATIALEPQVLRVDDLRLQRLHWWDISARPLA